MLRLQMSVEHYVVYNHSQQHLIAELKTMQHFSIDQHDLRQHTQYPKNISWKDSVWLCNAPGT